MAKPLTYAESGVDRDERSVAKATLKGLSSTYKFSRYGEPIVTPFNTLYPVGSGKYQVKTCDGIGTKVLLAELAGKHDTVGVDAVAMVVNDAIRCGARPMALTNVIDIKRSTPELLTELSKGLLKGCEESECAMIGGETADVPELMSTLYHINCDCVGEIEKEKIITGEKIQEGDVIVGLPSSGVHSNGLSLVRRALFKKWGGKYDASDKPEGFSRELVLEALEPTRIYVKDFFKAFENHELLGAIHITGDAYLKFKRLTSLGFEFDNFKPQPIFELIREAGGIEPAEMFKTFNMGWGFAFVVRPDTADGLVQTLSSAGAERIGRVVEGGKVKVSHYGSEFYLG